MAKLNKNYRVDLGSLTVTVPGEHLTTEKPSNV